MKKLIIMTILLVSIAIAKDNKIPFIDIYGNAYELYIENGNKIKLKGFENKILIIAVSNYLARDFMSKTFSTIYNKNEKDLIIISLDDIGYQTKNGFEYISKKQDNKNTKIKSFVKENDINYIISRFEEASKIYAIFNKKSQGWPEIFIFDKKGINIYHNFGYSDNQSKVYLPSKDGIKFFEKILRGNLE